MNDSGAPDPAGQAMTRCEELHAMTCRLAGMAERGEWDQLGDLRQRRDAGLRAFFDAHPAGSLDRRCAERLREIREMDLAVLACATQHQETLAGEAGSLRRGREAARTYAAHRR